MSSTAIHWGTSISLRPALAPSFIEQSLFRLQFRSSGCAESPFGWRARWKRAGMAVRNGLVAAAAIAIAVGAGFELRSAQSFTIPNACVGGSACAYVCSSVLEQGRTAADFIALAAYQLGPERPILLPPANLTMPPPVDPHNVYAGAGVGMFSPAVAGQPSRDYSPNLVTGKVDVIDPETFKVIDSLAAMPSPEHIVPSWDLQTLWVS